MEENKKILKKILVWCWWVVAGVAALRILLVAWDLFFPKSTDDVFVSIISNAMPFDLGKWGFIGYLFIEAWWAVKLMAMLGLFYLAASYAVEKKIGGTVVMSLFALAAIFTGFRYELFDSPRFNLVKGGLGFTFSKTLKRPVQPSAEHLEQGIVAYGIATRNNAPLFTSDRGWEESDIAIGDTIYIIAVGEAGPLAGANDHTSTILHHGNKEEIYAPNYNLLQEEYTCKDRLLQIFD